MLDSWQVVVVDMHNNNAVSKRPMKAEARWLSEVRLSMPFDLSLCPVIIGYHVGGSDRKGHRCRHPHQKNCGKKSLNKNPTFLLLREFFLPKRSWLFP